MNISMMSYISTNTNNAVSTTRNVPVPPPPARPLTPKGGRNKGSPRYTTDSISHFVSPKSSGSRKVPIKRQRRGKKKDTLTTSMREILFPDNQSTGSCGSHEWSEKTDDDVSMGGISTFSSASLASMNKRQQHKDPADNFLFMANYRKSKKQYDRALTFYLKALKVRVGALGEDHIETVPIINEMAGILLKQKEYGKAMKKYQKALNVLIKALGWDHERTAEAYCHIANILQIKGEYVGCMRVYQLVLAIRLKTLKRDDPELADTYNRIASVHFDKGEYAESLKMYQRVWAIQFKNIGPEHLDTATTFCCIAKVLKKQDKNENARTMYREALKIQTKHLGPKHSKTVRTKKLYQELDSENSVTVAWQHASMSSL